MSARARYMVWCAELGGDPISAPSAGQAAAIASELSARADGAVAEIADHTGRWMATVREHDGAIRLRQEDASALFWTALGGDPFERPPCPDCSDVGYRTRWDGEMGVARTRCETCGGTGMQVQSAGAS